MIQFTVKFTKNSNESISLEEFKKELLNKAVVYLEHEYLVKKTELHVRHIKFNKDETVVYFNIEADCLKVACELLFYGLGAKYGIEADLICCIKSCEVV
jgi:hypothetical protein